MNVVDEPPSDLRESSPPYKRMTSLLQQDAAMMKRMEELTMSTEGGSRPDISMPSMYDSMFSTDSSVGVAGGQRKFGDRR